MKIANKLVAIISNFMWEKQAQKLRRWRGNAENGSVFTRRMNKKESA
ncbi:MAG: hypothetical protein AAB422_01345 [Planctomycetota bacterium]